MEKVLGTVFNIQRYSIDDGPGIRTIVFLKGCPLKCLWCCNPESQKKELEVSHNGNLCMKCGKCARVCPSKAITMTENGPSINRKECVTCGTCAQNCVTQAVKIIGEEREVSEVFDIVYKDYQYYKESNGGVTVSGGEPLLQIEFVEALFKMAKEKGINTAVETCGMVPRKNFEKILPYVDLFLFDIKQMDDQKHKELTAVSNKQIQSNLEYIVSKGANVLIRLPLIPGMNDSDEDMKAVGNRVVELGLDAVELMPYHDYGSGKYGQLDKEYTLSHLQKHSDERIVEIYHIFSSMGIKCSYIK